MHRISYHPSWSRKRDSSSLHYGIMRCKTDIWPVAPHARCHSRGKEQAAEPLFDGGAARPIHPSFSIRRALFLSLLKASTSGKSCVRASIVGVLTEVRSLDCDAEVRQSAPLRTRRRRTKAQVCKSNTARIMRAKGLKLRSCSLSRGIKYLWAGAEAAAKLSTPAAKWKIVTQKKLF
jgi:hypothetical protein